MANGKEAGAAGLDGEVRGMMDMEKEVMLIAGVTASNFSARCSPRRNI